jgi:hypothetical protein
MKTSRLLAYAAAGMIVGLLMENKALTFKQKAKDEGRKMQDKTRKIRQQMMHHN